MLQRKIALTPKLTLTLTLTAGNFSWGKLSGCYIYRDIVSCLKTVQTFLKTFTTECNFKLKLNEDNGASIREVFVDVVQLNHFSPMSISAPPEIFQPP